MGEYIHAVATSQSDVNTHVKAIDEYFRKNFRKIDSKQALEILKPLGKHEKAQCLDGSFWTWETLEEAVRPDVEKFSDEDF